LDEEVDWGLVRDPKIGDSISDGYYVWVTKEFLGLKQLRIVYSYDESSNIINLRDINLKNDNI
jgi:hypothetical protein